MGSALRASEHAQSSSKWPFFEMKTAIDSSGRVVIPKAIRERRDLKPEVPLEIAVRDGVIVIEPMVLEDRDGGAWPFRSLSSQP